MNLPLLISVPHAGTQVPPEVDQFNLLTIEQIVKDGDEGASEIFSLQEEVAAYVSTNIARAYVDMNRAEDDRGYDGVVKTVTIYKESIYSRPLKESEIQKLISRYYQPYHRKLTRLATGVLLGIDCHTMAAEAPPICDDAGTTRPLLCLSNADGTCPEDWTQLMAECLEEAFGFTVSINSPFKGGHIIRSHSSELPWLQLELLRTEIITLDDRKKKILAAFRSWCERAGKPLKANNTSRFDERRDTNSNGGTPV